jgi:hypothetical protein
MTQTGAVEPADDTLMVITTLDEKGERVVLPDEEHEDEAAVYMSSDPDVQELLDAAREAYGPSALAVPVAEFQALKKAAGLEVAE